MTREMQAGGATRGEGYFECEMIKSLEKRMNKF